jgi:uncharacterized delta-60 repeat protein
VVGAGQVKIDLTTDDDIGRGLALQPDGKILVVGTSSSGGGYIGAEWSGSSKIFVARLDSSGALDPTFGTSGVAWPDLGQNAIAYAVRVQTDGAILAAGRRWTDVTNEAVLIRLTSAGSLDPAYAAGGFRALSIGNESGLATLTILPDGKPLATGYVHLGLGGEDVAVFKFGP